MTRQNHDTTDLCTNTDELRQRMNVPGFSSEDMDELIDKYGRGALLAYLGLELESRRGRERLHGYPPVFFLSYKWETETHFQWVKQFANALEAIGYRVLLDRDSCQVERPTDVPRYIARMVDCHYLVMIGTPNYVRSGTWVFDEINLALALKNARRCVLIPVVKEDDSSDVVYGSFANRMAVNEEKILDFRGVKDPTELVQRSFALYDGLSLTDAEQEQLRDALRGIRELMAREELLLAADAFNALPQAFRSTIDCQVLAALLNASLGHRGVARSIALDVLKTPDISEPTALECIKSLCFAESYVFALWEVGKLLVHECYDQYQLHYLAGILLWERGESRSALNHFRYCLRLGPKSADLMSFIGEILHSMEECDQAEQHYREAIEVDPSNPRAWSYLVVLLRDNDRTDEAMRLQQQAEEEFDRFTEWLKKADEELLENSREVYLHSTYDFLQHVVSCQSCRSRFVLMQEDDWICSVCGTVRPASIEKCMCGNVDYLTVSILQDAKNSKCPICRVPGLRMNA